MSESEREEREGGEGGKRHMESLTYFFLFFHHWIELGRYECYEQIEQVYGQSITDNVPSLQ